MDGTQHRACVKHIAPTMENQAEKNVEATHRNWGYVGVQGSGLCLGYLELYLAYLELYPHQGA